MDAACIVWLHYVVVSGQIFFLLSVWAPRGKKHIFAAPAAMCRACVCMQIWLSVSQCFIIGANDRTAVIGRLVSVI